MIDIRDTSGKIRFSTPVNAGSKRKFLLMKEDYITLKFSLDQHVYFRLGDYVDDPRFGLFELCDLYKPTFNNSNGGYDYELRLDAYYWKWKNKIFKFTPETGGQEASWNLTASLDVQLGIFLRNLQALGYTYKGTNFEFSIDQTVENSAKLMSYDSVNLLDALSRLAEAWGCEWWMEDSMIRFGRCEFGDPVDFELGKNVETMDRSESQNSYATRIYAFGSTRNLPVNYRPASTNLVQNGVAQKRLMLPVGTPYIDAQPNMVTVEAIEDVVIFEDVYPRRVATMADVVAREVTIENKEGEEPMEKVVTVYRFKDNGITFSNEYILAGQDLKITFQSGSLNGMTFSVLFDPNEKDEQLWEIVRNSDYSGEGRELPDKDLHPKDGDEFVLSGWDPTKITDLGLVASAEKELKAKAEKYVAKTKIDPSTYNNKMMSDSMVNEDGTLRLFELGDKVNLINPHFFEAGNRQSRVIGFEYNLDYPNDSPVYTVGETASYSRIGELESKLDSLTFNGQTYTGNGGNGVYVIGTNDSTPATNRNVLSALRSLSEFVSKKKDDIVQGVITFLKGLRVGKFVPGWIGTGAAITVDPKTGKTRLEVDEVLARERFETMEFRFNRIDVIDGEQWSTFAFGKIKSVDTESRIVYLDLVEGELMSSHVNDICRGIFHNLTAANAAGNKMDDCGFYTQAGFSTSYFTPTEILPDESGFKYALRPGTTQHPCAEMKFAAYGNLTDPSRRMSRVTNTRHSIYLKDVSVWQIDPDAHYGAAYGDLTGIVINGVEFNGYSSFQTNGYFKGHIEFLPDQLEELKGNDGYSVSLSSYDAIVAVDSQGNVDNSIYDIINVVDGQERVVTGDKEVITKRYKIHTMIQAYKGNMALVYDFTPGEGTYAASFTASGCECSLGDGVLTITKIAADKATVTIEVNCEGRASFTKLFTLTRVYGGINANWTTYIFKQSDEKPAPPIGIELMPAGWSDAPTAEGRWWMSMAIVDGITKLPGAWSEPVQVTSEDGGEADFKYAKNNSATQGPSISVNDRYPEGWDDNPPALSTGEFLWMSKAKVNPDNTLNGEWSAPVRISGEQGYSGDWTSYVFKEADNRPTTPTGTNPLPSGWSDGPGATGKWWMSKASINGITNEAREWSIPIQVSGQDGNGMYYEYAVNSSQTVSPTSGWSTTVPDVGSGQFLWMRWGQVIPPAIYPSSWEGVARVTGEKGERGQQGLQGIQGEKGDQGLRGPSGSDGSTSYFHIKYSFNSNGYPMTEDTSAPYIGTYVDYNPTDSSYYGDYTWKRFQGLQGDKGDKGIPGTNGIDGKTYYTHIKYSNDGGKTFTSNNGETPGSYIGFCVDLNVNDPSYVSAYTWSKIKGEDGRPGEDANMLPWVEDWDGEKVKIGGEYIASPKIYTGTVSNEVAQTGVAIGRAIISVNGQKKTGIVGIKNGNVTFLLDAETGDAKFMGEVNATKGTFKDGIFTNVTIESGKIAGFKISGTSLTNDGFDNDAAIVFKNNNKNTFAGFGGSMIPASSGATGVALIKNEEEGSWLTSLNYGMILSAKNAYNNIALGLSGGCVGGLAYKVEIISSSVTLKKETVVVLVNTSNAITIYLPSMDVFDDGHVIKFKRIAGYDNGTNPVAIRTSYGYNMQYNDITNKYERVYVPPAIMRDSSTIERVINLSAVGDAFELVYCRDVNHIASNSRGVWMQFKHPRDW